MRSNVFSEAVGKTFAEESDSTVVLGVFTNILVNLDTLLLTVNLVVTHAPNKNIQLINAG